MTTAQKQLFAYRYSPAVRWTADEWRRWLLTHYQVPVIGRLTDAQAQEALVQLRARVER